MPCNEADAVRLARLQGKKMAIKMKLITNKNISFITPVYSMYTLENKAKK
jgi:hypothetical protein